MRKAVFLSAALLLSACATTAPRPAPGHWLVGTWLMLGEGVEYPLACESGLPIAYNADGTYDLFEDSGTWRLDGSRLTEVATEHHDSGGEGGPELGRLYVSTIQRSGPDAFRKTYADGAVETFRRCPGA